jgi:hypothetical protein
MAENLTRIQCPIWERSSEQEKVFRGSIAIDSLKQLQVYDDVRWPSAPFPELIIPLFGVGAGIKLKPIKSRNNNHRIGKITVTASTATVFPSIIHAGEVFTIILSLEDCNNTVIGMMNSWKKSELKSK